jgi:hypothetical protein
MEEVENYDVVNDSALEPSHHTTDESPLQLNEIQHDEDLFYSLTELDAIEDDLAKQALAYGGSQSNPHMLLMPQYYRARLYFLDPETKWIDIGTGYFRILLTKDQSEHYMQIVSEVNGANSTKRRLSQDDDEQI